jgi:C1A family cysteine protease
MKRKHFVIGLVALVSLFLISTLVNATELQDIKAAVKAKGAKWVAGETSISKLPPEQRKKRLGLLKPKAIEEQATANEIATSVGLEALPIELDWRGHSGDNYVTPVRDQGNCGSCWAFATAGALESRVLIANDTPQNRETMDLSEQVLVSCSGAGNCGGGYIDEASDYIRDTGLPGEDCSPYLAKNTPCRRAACSTYQTDTFDIDSWAYVVNPYMISTDMVGMIKDALLDCPLVTTMDVYADFYYYTGGVYQYTFGSYQGGHAILIVGFKDDASVSGGGYFIVKNSWGTDWGEDGYYKIAYSAIANPVLFGEWTIAYHKTVTSDCTYSISPTIETFGPIGGDGTIKVTAFAGCSWSALSNASWITIVSGLSGVGDGNVEYRVAPTKRNRKGTISVANQTFTVSQTRK